MRRRGPRPPQLKSAKERLDAKKKNNLIFFWKPYPWQLRLNETIREKITTAAISSNKLLEQARKNGGWSLYRYFLGVGL